MREIEREREREEEREGGREKKESVANKIYKSTGLAVDDILPVLPGNCEIVEDFGLINFKKGDSDE